MTRGRQTPPELKEKAIAVAVTQGNVAEAARQVGLPRTTVQTLITEDEYSEFRLQAQKEYIVSTWENIQALSDALTRKITSSRVENLPLTELTRALKDLKSTVENVVNNINIYNDNRSVLNMENAREAAYGLVKSDFMSGKLTREEIEARLFT